MKVSAVNLMLTIARACNGSLENATQKLALRGKTDHVLFMWSSQPMSTDLNVLSKAVLEGPTILTLS